MNKAYEQALHAYKEAFQAYDEATSILSAMLQTIQQSRHESSDYCIRQLERFDVILQYSLLQVGLANKCLDKNEVIFITDIAKYGDFCQYLKAFYNVETSWNEINSLNESVIQNVLNVTGESVFKIGQEFIKVFIVFDHATEDTDFAGIMLQCLAKIVYATMLSDGNVERNELNNGCLILDIFGNIKNALAQEHVGGHADFTVKNGKSINDFSVDKKQINAESSQRVDYTQKEKALVYIETDSGSGTGFLISQTGLFLTCNHVIAGTKEVYVRLLNSKNENIVCQAYVKYTNEEDDFAILQVSDIKNCYFYNLETDYSTLNTGDDVAVYGFPYGSALNENVMELEPSLTKGYIASKNKIQGRTCYYLDIRSAPGNSGGPVFSLKTKKVIGYLCGSYGSDRANIIYIRTLKTFFDTLVKE